MTEVLAAPGDGRSYFGSDALPPSSSPTLLALNTNNTYLLPSRPNRSLAASNFAPQNSPTSSSAPSSPHIEPSTFSKTPSFASTAASSLSLDPRTDLDEPDDSDIQFPSFETAKHPTSDPPQKEERPGTCGVGEIVLPSTALQRRLSSPFLQTVYDDQAVQDEPTRHVDYLSHHWRQEDIWSSWRYITGRRNVYGNGVRLENAAWRTWTKLRCNLTTVSPETLNWMKDCDVTWLYGPLHLDSRKSLRPGISPAPSRLSTSSSFIDKKPILKKKSASQTLLQRSISSHSLLKQAGAMLQAQQAAGLPKNPLQDDGLSADLVGSCCQSSSVNTPAVEEASTPVSALPSDTSSGLVSPSERRHIHFNNEVEQCIAVDSKDDEEAEADGLAPTILDDVPSPGDEGEDGEMDGEDDDDGVVMMKPVVSNVGLSNRSTPRHSFSSESKTIKPLPSTTLKFREDTPEPDEGQQSCGMNMFWPSGKTLASSSSQETLRPAPRHSNFLLDDDDDADMDLEWRPSSLHSSPRRGDLSSHMAHQGPPQDELDPPGMRRTPSGMFMPYDEDEEEAAMNNTMLGRVVDTVNTARDIAHVIWNVGWRH